jgi:hypothetical protein
MPTIFKVVGPRVVPVYQGHAARTITHDEARRFWRENTEIAGARGCYVFGVRAGKGITPAYVGKATRTFREETFAPHKLTRYQRLLADYRRGTPVLFFLLAPRRCGVPNVAHVTALEAFLIQAAATVNPELLNINGTRLDDWGIGGVLRSGTGAPSGAARHLGRLLRLRPTRQPSGPPAARGRNPAPLSSSRRRRR